MIIDHDYTNTGRRHTRPPTGTEVEIELGKRESETLDGYDRKQLMGFNGTTKNFDRVRSGR